MNCEQARELLPDYLAGNTDKAAREAVESHLSGCIECAEDVALWERLGALPEERPGPEMRVRFRRMLDAEARRRSGFGDWLGGWAWRPVWQGALAVALAAVGFVAGRATAGGSRPEGDVSRLRAEVRDLREMVTLSLLQQTSAVERLRGVNFSTRIDRSDVDVRRALIGTLQSDSSVDVRLAALDALRRYRQDADVRKGLIEALPRQESPLVQIGVIDSLVEFRERESVGALKALQADPEVNEVVRQRANWGIQQLSLKETKLQ
jgi:HEAT repeat protein/putative zinc finger protein